MTIAQYFGWQQYFRQLHAGSHGDMKPQTSDPDRMADILERVFHG